MEESGNFESPQISDLEADAKEAAERLWTYVTSVKSVRRRSGNITPFEPAKLERSIEGAFITAGFSEEKRLPAVQDAVKHVLEQLTRKFDGHRIPSSEDIHELVLSSLIERNFAHVAKQYADYKRLRLQNPMQTTESKPKTAVDPYAARRRRLPDERRSITHKFEIGPHQGYITVGLYDDGNPGEIFLKMSKEGSVMSGMVDAFATSISIGLQYGVPLRVFVTKFSHTRFEPSGATQNPNLPYAKSIVDYVFRWLALKFLSPEERQAIAKEEADAAAAMVADHAGQGAKLL